MKNLRKSTLAVAIAALFAVGFVACGDTNHTEESEEIEAVNDHDEDEANSHDHDHEGDEENHDHEH